MSFVEQIGPHCEPCAAEFLPEMSVVDNVKTMLPDLVEIAYVD
jgi:hypothetical protein